MVSGDPGIVPTVAARAGAAAHASAAAHATAATSQRLASLALHQLAHCAHHAPDSPVQRPYSVPLRTTTREGSGKLLAVAQLATSSASPKRATMCIVWSTAAPTSGKAAMSQPLTRLT